MAGEQQQPDEADDLLVGQPFAVHLGLHQPAGQVVGRVQPPGPDVVQEVRVHLPHDRRDRAHGLLAGLQQRLVRVDLLAEQEMTMLLRMMRRISSKAAWRSVSASKGVVPVSNS